MSTDIDHDHVRLPFIDAAFGWHVLNFAIRGNIRFVEWVSDIGRYPNPRYVIFWMGGHVYASPYMIFAGWSCVGLAI